MSENIEGVEAGAELEKTEVVDFTDDEKWNRFVAEDALDLIARVMAKEGVLMEMGNGTSWDVGSLLSKCHDTLKVTGETSDGYHTFDELYHHRAVLFSVVVKDHANIAWKSKRHHDGTMYDGMFIVGVDTPQGQATYHYDIDPYWEMFDCKTLRNAPEWDGHTPGEAIERIGSLA